MKLKDQTAIVTGAGRGFGRAIAMAFSPVVNPRRSAIPYSVTSTTPSYAEAVRLIPGGCIKLILDSPLLVRLFIAMIGVPMEG